MTPCLSANWNQHIVFPRTIVSLGPSQPHQFPVLLRSTTIETPLSQIGMESEAETTILVDTTSLNESTSTWRVIPTTTKGVIQLNLLNAQPLFLSNPQPLSQGSWITKLDLAIRVAMPEHICAIVHAPTTQESGYTIAPGLIDSGYRGAVCAVGLFPTSKCEFPAGSLQIYISFLVLEQTSLTFTTPILHPVASKLVVPPNLPDTISGPNEHTVVYTGKLFQTDDPEIRVDEVVVFKPKRSEDAGRDIITHKVLKIPPNGKVALKPSLREVNLMGTEAAYVLGRSSLNARGVWAKPTQWLSKQQCVFILENITNEEVVLPVGSKIAQLIHTKVPIDWIAPSYDNCVGGVTSSPPRTLPSIPNPPPYATIIIAKDFDREAPKSERGVGSFGSTGI
ncbi:deoxyuridine triphosphatase [Macropodid alphaherpesvirus 2]|uniref:Deoxyuridine triphosphatase n=1 Tax=Macropodid alphaherpesvirus 2 TaxID=83440 RepID=A0AAE7MLM3_9ALPH|nr:deoxyuridine triphosphatase [Macropodid alphaherpesvirus 2]QOD40224.1 deoxyuridine triphosphatase [Macropodid alphaherpesvirus 2]WGO49714.1 deoxyuridine triphosphatase [Macropodid alphaherpesvirus 2]